MYKMNPNVRKDIPPGKLSMPSGSSLSCTEAKSLSPLLASLKKKPLVLGDPSIISKLELETLMKDP
jgi:hypothetical protein